MTFTPGGNLRTAPGTDSLDAKRKENIMKILKALSDRFLKLFLSEVPAGACVPNIGECCSAPRLSHSCTGPCVKSTVC